MNYFKNLANSMPVYHDDFRFIQDYLREGIEAIFKGLGANPNKNYIVYGCEITDIYNGHEISEGYVWLNGELLHVPAQTVHYQSGGTFVFQKNTRFLDGGERDAAGVIVNPWEINEAIAVEVSAVGSNDLTLDGLRLNFVVRELIKSAIKWIEVGSSESVLQYKNGFQGGALGLSEIPFRYRITSDYELQMQGGFMSTNSFTAGSVIEVIDLTPLGFPEYIPDGYEYSQLLRQGADFETNLDIFRSDSNNIKIFRITVEIINDINLINSGRIDFKFPLK